MAGISGRIASPSSSVSTNVISCVARPSVRPLTSSIPVSSTSSATPLPMSSADTPPLDPPSDAELDSSDASSFITLPSSIRSALYRYENGRRRQALNEDYAWPCDASHARFELLQARLLEMTYETGLYFEPEPGKLAEVLAEEGEGGQGGKILDIGSGVTASWAISMAERFPESEVIGVDLVPSELEFLPQNLTIEISDVLEGLPYPDDFFSLIHIRMLQSALLRTSAPTLYAECARCLRPGGVLLLEEPETGIQLEPFAVCPPASFAALRARHDMHGQHWAGSLNDRAFVRGLELAMADIVRDTSGFQEGTVVKAVQDFGFGSRPNEGPPERQRGSLVREIWLLAWQLNSEKHPDAERFKEEDPKFIPREDVGLFFRHHVVWAEKGRTVAGEERGGGESVMVEGW